MNKKSKFLKTEFSAGEYLAPKVKVMGLRCRRVLSASETSMNSEEEDFD